MADDQQAWLADVRASVDAELDRRLAFPDLAHGPPGARALRDAIRYAALGPGKRLRPALVIASCEACGGDAQTALPAAAAVEMLHAYTLVHDDLPAMDDDDMRRGRNTVHVEYGEATAILAGDALLTEAFIALADLAIGAADAVRVLGRRGGTEELLAGQANDLYAERTGSQPSWEQVEHIHRGKTGALFAAAAEIGGICAECSNDRRRELAELGMTIGIAFQHGDDRLDDEHRAHRERARQRIEELASRASEWTLALGPRAAPLRAMVQWIAER